jgi:hypothetical protein
MPRVVQRESTNGSQVDRSSKRSAGPTSPSEATTPTSHDTLPAARTEGDGGTTADPTWRSTHPVRQEPALDRTPRLANRRASPRAAFRRTRPSLGFASAIRTGSRAPPSSNRPSRERLLATSMSLGRRARGSRHCNGAGSARVHSPSNPFQPATQAETSLLRSEPKWIGSRGSMAAIRAALSTPADGAAASFSTISFRAP